jgi:hypothetical protein
MEDLLERVIAIAQAFGRAEIPHSFGGAIALGFYAPVRTTARDIVQILDSIGEYLDVPYVLHWVEAIIGTDAAPSQQLTRALTQRSLLPDP